MSYAKEGSLKNYLPKIVKLNWYNKLQLLEKIIFGLKTIHESNLIHCDLHDGNILISDNHDEIFITDLGLCKPINNLQNSSTNDNDKVYGVLPYMAPEILRRGPYTPASDIYSFSMIMWEFTSGVRPFDDKEFDFQLSLSICAGEHPDTIENTPQCYINLMKKCWDSDPSKRPTIQIIEDNISEWHEYIKKYYEIIEKSSYSVKVYKKNISDRVIDGFTIDKNQLKDDIKEFIKADALVNAVESNESNTIRKSHSSYTSRLLDFTKQLQSECLDCLVGD